MMVSVRHLPARKPRVSLIGGIAVAAVLAGLVLQPALAAAADIVIGALLPMTGGNAPNGAQMKTGYELAIEEINAQGGIKTMGGSKLKLVVRGAERIFLAQLAAQLGLDAETTKRLERETDRSIDSPRA